MLWSCLVWDKTGQQQIRSNAEKCARGVIIDEIGDNWRAVRDCI